MLFCEFHSIKLSMEREKLYVEYFGSLKERDMGFSREKPFTFFKRTFERNMKVLLHYHDSLEINFSSNVNGTITIGENSLDLSHHKVIVLPPGHLHSYRIQKNSGCMLVLHISLIDLEYYLKLDNIFNFLELNPGLLPCVSPVYNELVPLLYEIEKIVTPLSSLPVFLNIFKILSRVEKRSAGLGDSGDDRIKRIVSFTESNYYRNLNLESICTRFGYTRYYFSRFFRKKTGFRYWDYLKHVRIEHSKEKLNSGKDIAQAGYECGFEDSSYFIRVFKSQTGITPGQYRKRFLVPSD